MIVLCASEIESLCTKVCTPHKYTVIIQIQRIVFLIICSDHMCYPSAVDAHSFCRIIWLRHGIFFTMLFPGLCRITNLEVQLRCRLSYIKSYTAAIRTCEKAYCFPRGLIQLYKQFKRTT